MTGTIDFDDAEAIRLRRDKYDNFKFFDKHYHMILGFYGDRTANRSGIPLINHINEGLFILASVDASLETMQAWCLHPIVQANEDFSNVLGDSSLIDDADIAPLILAMEYRHAANSYLSQMILTQEEKVALRQKVNQFEQVRFMLVADKIQNHKDFIMQPSGTYENEERLQEYFLDWIMNVLELSNDAFEYLTEIIVDNSQFSSSAV